MQTINDIGRLPDLPDAYFDGYQARENGEDDWNNPHEKGGEKWDDWHTGWVDAEFDLR